MPTISEMRQARIPLSPSRTANITANRGNNNVNSTTGTGIRRARADGIYDNVDMGGISTTPSRTRTTYSVSASRSTLRHGRPPRERHVQRVPYLIDNGYYHHNVDNSYSSNIDEGYLSHLDFEEADNLAKRLFEVYLDDPPKTKNQRKTNRVTGLEDVLTVLTLNGRTMEPSGVLDMITIQRFMRGLALDAQ